MILQLIRAHALLHQESRRRDDNERIIAEIEDYAAIRALVADLVAAGVEATVPKEVREAVECVADLLRAGKTEVQQGDLKQVLKLDKASISRRVANAIDRGLLKNMEDRKGRPARLVLADPLPADVPLLPGPERLRGTRALASPAGSP